MLNLNSQIDYGVAILTYLNKAPFDIFVPLSEIAEKEKLPVSFLARIIGRFKKSGIIESKEGKTGGCRLLKKLSDISLLAVIEAIEGPFGLVRCQRTGKKVCAKCNKKCGVLSFWQEVELDLRNYLSNKKLV